MERHALTLFVTLKEENAIQELFENRNWFLHRLNEGQNIVCKTCGCASFQVSFDPEFTDGGQGIDSLPESSKFSQKSSMAAHNHRLQLQPPIELLSKIRDEISDKTSQSEACKDLDVLQKTENHYTEIYDLYDENTRDYLINEIQLNKTEVTKDLDEQLNFHNLDQVNRQESGIEEVKQINNNDKLQQLEYGIGKIRLRERQLKNKVGVAVDKRGSSEEITRKREDSKHGNFHCTSCNVTFKLLGPFNNHKKDGKCVFTCEFCGKVFTSRYYYNYQIHLKYHRNERSYSCEICGKSYIEKNSLNIHKRKHANDRPYVCDLCGKCFFSSSHLVYHKKSMHTIRNEIHQCDICGAVLSTLGNLKVHKKTVHLAERAFTCEICGKAFKTRKALEQKHAIVHKNSFPYKCSYTGCNKSFKTSGSLNCHIKRHKNQRSHFCVKCGKGFYSKKDLGLHDRVHSGLKPYSCKFCDYTCTLSGNLRKHLKIHE